MAVVSSYSEAELAAYFLNLLGATATTLGWTTQADVQTAIDDTLYAYGVSAIAAATSIRKLRTIGRRELWRRVADETAGYHKFTADGASYDLQQIHEQAVRRLALAETDCLEFGAGGFAVRVDRVIAAQDPYGPTPREDVGYP